MVDLPPTPQITDLDALPFDNRFTAALPADPREGKGLRQPAGAAFSRVLPTPTANPHTLSWSPEVGALLGLSPQVCASDDFAAVFSGNRTPAGADPFAMRYGGHQFGNWADQLGDGRAIALGEVIDSDGGHQTLQLKGPGETPYSRRADGRAVLRSSVREYLCSEAMHHLGVPTTRALSLVLTGDDVVRDVLYDGHPAPEPGAVVCRVAPSFVRFGSFQLPAAHGEGELLRALIEHTIRSDFPHLAPLAGAPLGAEHIDAWFDEVVDRTIDLAVHWMRVGFVHGVLNTDNMSILGLTIDYGPYGWLEGFDAMWTPNTTDAEGRRYRYGAQPQIVHWNLLQLANALANVVEDTTGLQHSLNRFKPEYGARFLAMTVARLGWGAVQDDDGAPVDRLYVALAQIETDQVLFFRDLQRVPTAGGVTDEQLLAPLAHIWYSPGDLVGDVRATWLTWLRDWAARVRSAGLSNADRATQADALNPRFVLRNYIAQEVIDAATAGDAALLHEVMDVLRRPYDEQPGKERFSGKRPEWARTKVGCSMLSCSS